MKVFNTSLLIFLVFISVSLWVGAHGKYLSKNGPNSRIVNGDEVEPHSLPYMVAIRSTKNGNIVPCGGSLITASLVLTSAKCVDGASEIELLLGAHDLANADAAQIKFTTSKYFIHEEYNGDTLLNDIAVVQLPAGVTLNENIKTVTLPKLADILTDYDEKLGFVAGWGKVKDTDTSTSNILHAINVTIIPTLICQLPYLFSVNMEQMCTTGVDHMKNICLGDSGSPLIVDGVQVGIASHGSSFGCEAGFPGVYTRLTSYLSWLGQV